MLLASGTTFAAVDTCFWRQTASCTAWGRREPQNDKFCDAKISGDKSGFCECAPGVATAAVGCGHAPLVCRQRCPKPKRPSGSATASQQMQKRCEGYAAAGECGRNPAFMLSTCRKECEQPKRANSPTAQQPKIGKGAQKELGGGVPAYKSLAWFKKNWRVEDEYRKSRRQTTPPTVPVTEEHQKPAGAGGAQLPALPALPALTGEWLSAGNHSPPQLSEAAQALSQLCSPAGRRGVCALAQRVPAIARPQAEAGRAAASNATCKCCGSPRSRLRRVREQAALGLERWTGRFAGPVVGCMLLITRVGRRAGTATLGWSTSPRRAVRRSASPPPPSLPTPSRRHPRFATCSPPASSPRDHPRCCRHPLPSQVERALKIDGSCHATAVECRTCDPPSSWVAEVRSRSAPCGRREGEPALRAGAPPLCSVTVGGWPGLPPLLQPLRAAGPPLPYLDAHMALLVTGRHEPLRPLWERAFTFSVVRAPSGRPNLAAQTPGGSVRPTPSRPRAREWDRPPARPVGVAVEAHLRPASAQRDELPVDDDAAAQLRLLRDADQGFTRVARGRPRGRADGEYGPLLGCAGPLVAQCSTRGPRTDNCGRWLTCTRTLSTARCPGSSSHKPNFSARRRASSPGRVEDRTHPAASLAPRPLSRPRGT